MSSGPAAAGFAYLVPCRILARNLRGIPVTTTKTVRADPPGLVDGARCKVIDGTHKGKSGLVRDINTSKGGNVTITVVQADGERFKTLARNVEIVRR